MPHLELAKTALKPLKLLQNVPVGFPEPFDCTILESLLTQLRVFAEALATLKLCPVQEWTPKSSRQVGTCFYNRSC